MKEESFYRQALQHMERTVDGLAKLLPPPQLVEVEPEIYFMRYVERMPPQAIVMKLARVTTALHSALTLLKAGLLQDLGAIQRIIDEQNEDVAFLCQILFTGETSKLHEQFLKEFWQEEWENIGKPNMRNIPRNRASREAIRGYLSNTPSASQINQSRLVATTNMVAKTYSGFVHGAGSHIMDMCGGTPPSFHVSGMRDTPRWDEQREDLQNYFYRSIGSFELTAKAFGLEKMAISISEFRRTFEQTFEMNYFDEMGRKLAPKNRQHRQAPIGSKPSGEQR